MALSILKFNYAVQNCVHHLHWQSIRRQFATTLCRISDLCLPTVRRLLAASLMFFVSSLHLLVRLVHSHVYSVRLCVCAVIRGSFMPFTCQTRADATHDDTNARARHDIVWWESRDPSKTHTQYRTVGTHHIQSTHPQTCHRCHACPCHQTHVYRSMNACDKQL